MSAPSETAFFGVDEINLMRSEKKKEEKIERKNLLNALWFVGLTKGGQFEVWHLERFHIVINFYSTRSQKGSSLQEKVLSVCLFVCPSSLFLLQIFSFVDLQFCNLFLKSSIVAG